MHEPVLVDLSRSLFGRISEISPSTEPHEKEEATEMPDSYRIKSEV